MTKNVSGSYFFNKFCYHFLINTYMWYYKSIHYNYEWTGKTSENTGNADVA
jgi:hypothetical protein